MANKMKHQYSCSSCDFHGTLPAGSNFCPVCGGNVKSKVEQTAKEKIAEIDRLLPILEEKYQEFANIYAEYKKLNETLRTYAARGIISREQVVDFKPERLTDIFYKSRNHKNTTNI